MYFFRNCIDKRTYSSFALWKLPIMSLFVFQNIILKNIEHYFWDWLGLDCCKDTLVGDATVKGISGGQKRRLSIGVETCADYSCLLSNLPTNGLDAKTAFDIVNTARTLCLAGKVIIFSYFLNMKFLLSEKVSR